MFVMLRNAPDLACRHHNNHMSVESAQMCPVEQRRAEFRTARLQRCRFAVPAERCSFTEHCSAWEESWDRDENSKTEVRDFPPPGEQQNSKPMFPSKQAAIPAGRKQQKFGVKPLVQQLLVSVGVKSSFVLKWSSQSAPSEAS